MTHMTHLQPPGWAEPKGYSNGVAVTLMAGSKLIFVGGQIGWNAAQDFETDDFVAQCRQALQNTRAVLQAGGAGPEHMTRMTWYVTDRDVYTASLRELGAAYREVLGKHFPPMTCVEVSRLMEPRALVEIEVTAVV